MKIFNLGLDVPAGKRQYKDGCFNKLVEKFSPQKKTPYAVEITETGVEKCDAVVFSEEKRLDFVLLDLERIEKRMLRAEDEKEKTALARAQRVLESETLLSEGEFSAEEKEVFKAQQLLTLKPSVGRENTESIDIDGLVSEVMEKARVILFFTAGKKEVRAWNLKKGETVLQAAGKIHSDLKRGFIKADIVNCKDLDSFFNLAEAKSRGMMKTVNRDYVVLPGDIIDVRFNV